MALTRSEIESLVESNTGRDDKSSYIQTKCNQVLKLACLEHVFHDILSEQEYSITEDATEIDLTTNDDSEAVAVFRIATVMVTDSNDKFQPLKIKNRHWFNKFVGDTSANMQGWPVYCMRWGSKLLLDRPAISDLTATIKLAQLPSFSADDTECPIEILDAFVEAKVTAEVFYSIGDMDKFRFWHAKSEDILKKSIAMDDYELGEDLTMTRSDSIDNGRGITIFDSDSGETNIWF